MLDEQAGGQDVVAVDEQAGVAGVDGPAGGCAAVVGAPAQMWSMMVSSLCTARVVVALPWTLEPMRKKTSWMLVGLVAWSVWVPGRPTLIRVGLLVVPASKVRPLILTPSTSATLRLRLRRWG